jgi:hypothetical protein
VYRLLSFHLLPVNLPTIMGVAVYHKKFGRPCTGPLCLARMVLSCNPLMVVPLLRIVQADKYTCKYRSTPLLKYQVMKLQEGVQIKLCPV